ncbi:ABC transporter permease [Pseudaminobacter sp. 19-2017]|uniref:ABC transporter permease n=1 Tax=Pseudaminobacter soli (ex Zhang et al. 2022) TaxID=2831468 RepID=A0A942E6L4_9HYPH|nr:ABC transporter permease [Pseudaminobacter soli]MBS3652088.1 ABC transporter permease [Pseudaminobacter soli]
MTPMLRAIVLRLGSAALTLLIVSSLIFAALEMLPGGFAQATLGQAATPEAVAAFNKELGLDRPALVRYLEWLGAAAQGDLGVSYAGGSGSARRDIATLISDRLYNTFFLAAYAALLAIPLALALGISAALWRNSWYDRVVNTSTLAAIALPEFFVAYVLIYCLAIKLNLAGALSNVDASTGFFEHLKKATLPALTLTLVILAHIMRMTRASIISLLDSPYVEMARLKGTRPAKIILRHVLPNAWAPIISIIVFDLAYLISGAVVVEVVFVYPGIGQLMVDAVSSRDMPVVQACALIFAVTYVGLNLLADIMTTMTNPQLRYKA